MTFSPTHVFNFGVAVDYPDVDVDDEDLDPRLELHFRTSALGAPRARAGTATSHTCAQKRRRLNGSLNVIWSDGLYLESEPSQLCIL